MLKENEVVMLVLGISVILLIILNINHIRNIRYWKFLLTSFLLMLSGWLFTVVEGFMLEQLLNIIEHSSYLASAVFLAVWSWKYTSKQKEEKA